MWFFNIFKKKIIANCGHEAKEKDTVTAFGENTETIIPIINGKTDYCHRCLEKMAIRCAWCGGVIFIGDPITLYTPSDENFKIPEYAVVHKENPLQLVGCLGRNCAETGADRAGFWYPPGSVKCVASPLEMAMQSGKAVAVGNLSDPEEAEKGL
jgi:hypothetical protein